MSLDIKDYAEEITAYDKWIHFTYKGESYYVALHWDKYDGYDLNFTDSIRSSNWIPTPDWAIEWEDREDTGDSLEYTLDYLTESEVSK